MKTCRLEISHHHVVAPEVIKAGEDLLLGPYLWLAQGSLYR